MCRCVIYICLTLCCSLTSNLSKNVTAHRSNKNCNDCECSTLETQCSAVIQTISFDVFPPFCVAFPDVKISHIPRLSTPTRSTLSCTRHCLCSRKSTECHFWNYRTTATCRRTGIHVLNGIGNLCSLQHRLRMRLTQKHKSGLRLTLGGCC